MTGLAERIAPHCREAPPWTACGDPASADFGTVYAWRGANGAVVFAFDRAGLRHALTLFRHEDEGAQVVIHGRRFDVAPR